MRIADFHSAFLPPLPIFRFSVFGSRRPWNLKRIRTHLPSSIVALKPPPQAQKSTSSPSSETETPDPASPSNTFQTALMLQAVPFLWGTYPPATYYLSHLPNPPPTTLLNICIYLTALLPFPILRSPGTKLPLAEGAELGTYLFFGTILLLSSLQHTTPARAALLVQSTTIFVPVLSYLLGRAVSLRVSFGAVVAMVGVYILEQAVGAITYGDALALASALCYSVHVLRLEAIEAPSLPLVEAKTRFQTLYAGLLLAFSHSGTKDYLQGVPSLPTWEIFALIIGVLWLGIGSTSLATWLQVISQRRVGASRAAVFYATQPAWAVGLAYLSGLDTINVNELIGGGMILFAGLLTGLD